MNILQIKRQLEQSTGYEWVVSQRLELGILTTNQAFKEAKIQGRSPLHIAQDITNEIQNKYTELLVVTTAGPYVNVSLSQEYYQTYQNNLFEYIRNVYEAKSNELVLIDYFSPNVGKKMHIGHIRSGNLGEAISNILRLKYNQILSDNHLGDWGIQFGLTIWGILHIDRLNISNTELNWQSVDYHQVVDTLYRIYVDVNALIENDETVRVEAQQIAFRLEQIKSQHPDYIPHKGDELIIELFHNITQLSIKVFHDGEKDLKLNQHKSSFSPNQIEDLTANLKSVFKDSLDNLLHIGEFGEFDLILGESQYVIFYELFDILVKAGVAVQEGKAIYVDLEKEKLGRCYLISSEGYTLYHSRDIIARFVWAGIIGAQRMISLSDNRQNHSFKQTFAVVQRIIDARIFDGRPFPRLSQAQTDIAIQTLSNNMAEHASFGFMSIEGGAMSTRKGRIITYQYLRDTLIEEARNTLFSKSNINVDTKAGDTSHQIKEQTVDAVAVAALKWADLFRDRDQDTVFDIQEFVSFEGNTGVYQLYTVARLKSIIRKHKGIIPAFEYSRASDEEKLILTKISLLPIVIDEITTNLKPHTLCSHVYEIASLTNSWYASNSITQQQEQSRKKHMLGLCELIITHQTFCLDLLGISVVEEL